MYRAEARHFTGPRQVGSALAKALGFSPRDFVEMPELWPSRIHSEDRPRVLSRLSSARRREPISIEYRVVCADGSERVFLDRGSWSADADDGTHLIGACLDITERRQLEQRLLWSERFEHAGRYLRVQGHDMMNMLSAIQLNLEGLQRSMGANGIEARERTRIARALAGVDRGVELFQRLMSFAGRLSSRSRRVDMAALVAGIDGLIRSVIGEGARLKLDLADALWPAQADEGQIMAALIALATHAREGMAANGELVISGRNETRTASTAELAAGDYVAVTVGGSDDGRGGSGAERVFEPITGSSDESRMSLVRGIARHWGGQLMSLGDDPKCETLRLLLPRWGPPAGA